MFHVAGGGLCFRWLAACLPAWLRLLASGRAPRLRQQCRTHVQRQLPATLYRPRACSGRASGHQTAPTASALAATQPRIGSVVKQRAAHGCPRSALR